MTLCCHEEESGFPANKCCSTLNFSSRLSVVMPHSETRMVTGDDSRNTVKENAGQSHNYDCTISPISWQGSQKMEEVFAHWGLISLSNGVAIRPRLDAASAAAYLLTTSKRYQQAVDILGVGGVHGAHQERDENGGDGDSNLPSHFAVLTAD